jgi:hypothetical protein
MIILVMVAEMVMLQPEPKTSLHGEVVRCVMEHVIADITKNQSGKHARRQAPENQKEETIKKKRKRDADAWRHHEPSCVVWIIVMNTVNNVMQPFPQMGLGFVMKYVPVDEVLDERPE